MSETSKQKAIRQNIKTMKTCIQVSYEVMIPVDEVFAHGDGIPNDGFVDSHVIRSNIIEYLNRRHGMNISEGSDLTMPQIATWIQDVCPVDRHAQVADLDITVWQNNEQLYDGRKRPA